jgi:hypothetical protein
MNTDWGIGIGFIIPEKLFGPGGEQLFNSPITVYSMLDWLMVKNWRK